MTQFDRDARSGELPPGGTPEDSQTPQRPGVTGGSAGDDGSIADRLGRDPGNLGDDVAELGDITHPTPDPAGSQI